MTQPEWSNDPEQLKAQQDERKRLVKLKRKSRDESDSPGRYSRDRSATTGAARLNQSVQQPSLYHSIEEDLYD
jgi:hypothetical protein